MKILVVVDMQNDFIDQALGTKEAQDIVPLVAKRIKDYRKNNDPVIFTQDTHGKDYHLTQEGLNLPVIHCIKGTVGWQISDQLQLEDSVVIEKNTFGSKLKLAQAIVDEVKKYAALYPNPELKGLAYLQEIEIVGLCTDICVISNALILKAHFPETMISVNQHLCAGVTVQTHLNALEAMKMCQIKII